MGQKLDKAISTARTNANQALLFIDRAVGLMITEAPTSDAFGKCANFMLDCLKSVSTEPITFMFPKESESANVAVLLAVTHGFTVLCGDEERARYLGSLRVVETLLTAVDLRGTPFLAYSELAVALCGLFAAIAPQLAKSMDRFLITRCPEIMARVLALCASAQSDAGKAKDAEDGAEKEGDAQDDEDEDDENSVTSFRCDGCARAVCTSLCRVLEVYGDPAVRKAVECGAVASLVGLLSRRIRKGEATLSTQIAVMRAFDAVVVAKGQIDVGLQALADVDGWAPLVVAVAESFANGLSPGDEDGAATEGASAEEVKRREGLMVVCSVIAALCGSGRCVDALLGANVLHFIVCAQRLMRKCDAYHTDVTGALAGMMEAIRVPDGAVSELNAAKANPTMLVTYGTVEYIGSCLQTRSKCAAIMRNCGRFTASFFKERAAPNGILRDCLTLAPPGLGDVLVRSFVPAVLDQLVSCAEQRDAVLTVVKEILIPIAQFSHAVARQLVVGEVLKKLQTVMQNHPDDVEIPVACLDALYAIVYDGEECTLVANTFKAELLTMLRFHAQKPPVLCAVMRLLQNLARLPSLDAQLADGFLQITFDTLKRFRAQEEAILSVTASKVERSNAEAAEAVVVAALRAIAFMLGDPAVYARLSSEELIGYARDVLQREADQRLETEGGPRATRRAPPPELLVSARALVREVDPRVLEAESLGLCTHAFQHTRTCRADGPCIAADRGYCPVCAMSQRLRVCLDCRVATTHHYCALCWEKCHHDHKFTEVFLPSSCFM